MMDACLYLRCQNLDLSWYIFVPTNSQVVCLFLGEVSYSSLFSRLVGLWDSHPSSEAWICPKSYGKGYDLNVSKVPKHLLKIFVVLTVVVLVLYFVCLEPCCVCFSGLLRPEQFGTVSWLAWGS